MELLLVTGAPASLPPAAPSDAQRVFWLGRFEVTVAQFEAFEAATGSRAENTVRSRYAPTASHPAVGVTFDEADAFAAWLSRKENRPYRLPREFEWQLAAAGPQKLNFPWGSAPGRSGVHGNWGRVLRALAFGALATLEPVGSFPEGRSPLGFEDLVGNAAEWCLWDTPEAATVVKTSRVAQHPLRGGCWNDQVPPTNFERTLADDNQGYKCFGFRVLLEANGPRAIRDER
jgi:formylglycine-generating enzyme required for sulfatase activity